MAIVTPASAYSIRIQGFTTADIENTNYEVKAVDGPTSLTTDTGVVGAPSSQGRWFGFADLATGIQRAFVSAASAAGAEFQVGSSVEIVLQDTLFF